MALLDRFYCFSCNVYFPHFAIIIHMLFLQLLFKLILNVNITISSYITVTFYCDQKPCHVRHGSENMLSVNSRVSYLVKTGFHSKTSFEFSDFACNRTVLS